MSSLLGHEESVIFVHDADRLLEAFYSFEYLGPQYANGVMPVGTDFAVFYT